MGHIPDENNTDDFMNASAEEWSKPEPAPEPKASSEKTNRWGSPIPDPLVSSDSGYRDSESMGPTGASYKAPGKTSNSKLWIILIVAVVVMCLCTCLIIFGLPALGLSFFDWNSIQY